MAEMVWDEHPVTHGSTPRSRICESLEALGTGCEMNGISRGAEAYFLAMAMSRETSEMSLVFRGFRGIFFFFFFFWLSRVACFSLVFVFAIFFKYIFVLNCDLPMKK